MLHLARYSSITPSDFERALGISVGFDSMFDRFLGEVESSESATGYPPYNIRKDEENIYTIEMAVAGFSKEDLEADHIERIGKRMANRMPAFADAKMVRSWTGPYDIPPDWNPIIGPVPGITGVHVAVGFSGHGFKLAPTVGES
ncbi:MAG: FAD-dependent oxidoreductase, partial [SAR324 cluster bacterium]|nr:FAD-dependent oxidoreductase [SAR324 cluster bacterium]